MKNKIKINEATFKRIIAESVKGILNEISPELMGAAAMTAAHRARNTNDPYYKDKYKRQAWKFSDAAQLSNLQRNPNMTYTFFDPYEKEITAFFNRRNPDGSYNNGSIRYDASKRYNKPDYHISNNEIEANKYQGFDYDEKSVREKDPDFVKNMNMSDDAQNRYANFKNNFIDIWNKVKNYQPHD